MKTGQSSVSLMAPLPSGKKCCSLLDLDFHPSSKCTIFIFLDFIVNIYVNTSNNINTRLLLILLRFQMTGAATPCYWSDFQPTLNPDILIFQYYAKPTMPRLMPTSHVIRKQWVFVIDQIISDLAHSSSPRINYFRPQQGSILTHWCGNECQPPTVLQNPIYNCPPLFFGVGRHPVDYFSFEGTKRWWVENGPRGSGPLVWTSVGGV